MAFSTVTWATGDIITEAKLDAMAANTAYLHDATQVVLLHAAQLKNARWPVAVILDETVIIPVVDVTPYPYSPRQFNNIAIDGLLEGIHTLAFWSEAGARTYKTHFFKTEEMKFMTLWIVFTPAVIISVLGHATEQAGWV